MKKLIRFFQTVVVLVGVAVATFLLWEPHLEGRNVGATWSEIYFNDPFLAYVYVASIAFFVVLFQIFKILSYVTEGRVLSSSSVRSLRIIKYSSILLGLFAIGAEIYLFTVQLGKDDIIGGVVIGAFVIVVSAVFAVISNTLEDVLDGALNLKEAFSKLRLFRS